MEKSTADMDKLVGGLETAVQAVPQLRSVFEAQHDNAGRNAALTDDMVPEVRVGIALGEVVVLVVQTYGKKSWTPRSADIEGNMPRKPSRTRMHATWASGSQPRCRSETRRRTWQPACGSSCSRRR